MRPLKVLLVDDSPTDRIIFKRYLQQEQWFDYHFIECASAEEALQRCQEQPPDCILLDFNLPDADGMEVLETLVGRNTPPTFAILILTEEGDLNTAVSAMKAGAYDYIIKSRTRPAELSQSIFNAMERLRLAQQVVEQQQALKAKNQELNEFFYIVSHDLKEPLRKILVFSERIRGRLEEPGVLVSLDDTGARTLTIADSLERIERSATRMNQLLGGLLDYSKMTMKPCQSVWLDLRVLITEILSDLEVQIEASNGRIILDNLPVLEADPIQMRQLFQNLLNNALKFTRHGEAPQVEISCRPLATAEAESLFGPECARQQYVDIRFSDNGIGFEAHYAEQIFRIFERLNKPGQYPGTGIGLTICRKIVQRHRGKIFATSGPGQGATFRILLPVRQTGITLPASADEFPETAPMTSQWSLGRLRH
jgi:signal transduction histidine kinase